MATLPIVMPSPSFECAAITLPSAVAPRAATSVVQASASAARAVRPKSRNEVIIALFALAPHTPRPTHPRKPHRQKSTFLHACVTCPPPSDDTQRHKAQADNLPSGMRFLNASIMSLSAPLPRARFVRLIGCARRCPPRHGPRLCSSFRRRRRRRAGVAAMVARSATTCRPCRAGGDAADHEPWLSKCLTRQRSSLRTPAVVSEARGYHQQRERCERVARAQLARPRPPPAAPPAARAYQWRRRRKHPPGTGSPSRRERRRKRRHQRGAAAAAGAGGGG